VIGPVRSGSWRCHREAARVVLGLDLPLPELSSVGECGCHQERARISHQAGATGTEGSSTSRRNPSQSGVMHWRRRQAARNEPSETWTRHTKAHHAHTQEQPSHFVTAESQEASSIARHRILCRSQLQPRDRAVTGTRAFRMPARRTSGRLRQVPASLRKIGVSGTATASLAETSNRGAWPSAA
jgi:hypothetical protein